MLVMVIANLFGLFAFIYLMWLKLKEDYHYERIFNFSFIILFGLLITSVFSRFFFQEYWFWLNLIGLTSGFVFGLFLLKFKFYESLNSFVVAILPYLGIYFLSSSIIKYSLVDFVAFWVVTVFIFFYFLFEATYRKFNWYKSGRVGFSGLLVAGLFFLARAILAYFFVNQVSLVGTVDVYLSASFSFLFFLLLFNLSRNTA